MINLIEDFVEDLNYNNMVLDLKHINKIDLYRKLKKDNLNKIRRIADSDYLWVENCDFQGEEINNEKDLQEMRDDGYVVYCLYYAEGIGYFILHI